jgi:hypothetical protein
MSKNCLVMVLSESGLKRNNGQQIVNDMYYCPVLGCKYNLHFGQSMKSFKTQKLLKQVSLLAYTLYSVLHTFYC